MSSKYRLSKTTWVLSGLALVATLFATGSSPLSALVFQSAPPKPQQTTPPTAPPAKNKPQPTPGTTPGAAEARQQPGNPGQRQGGPNQRPEWVPFWKDPAIKAEIGLTEVTANKIDKIWEQGRAAREPYAKEVEKQQTELDRLIRERTASDFAIALQVGKVEAPRSEMNKNRVLMYYHMYQELTADQYKKLQAVFDRHDKDRGRGRGGQR